MTDETKLFLQFDYPAMMDIGKQILTVAVAVLALSVVFAKKIVNFQVTRTPQKVAVITVWTLLLFSAIASVAAMGQLFTAAMLAKSNHLYQDFVNEWNNWNGAAFIAFFVALVVLIGLSINMVFSKPKTAV